HDSCLGEGDGHQGIDVPFARPRQRDDGVVDHLFAAELNASDEPTGGWMKPEDRADALLDDLIEPIATADVQQLVARDRLLDRFVEIQHAGRKDDHRANRSESDRSGNRIRDPDLGAYADSL